MQKLLLSQKVSQVLRFDRAFRFVWHAAPGWTLAGMGLVTIQGALPLLTLYLMKLIVDAVTVSLGAPEKMAAFPHIILLISFAAGAALLNALFQQIAGFVKEAQTLKVTDHMFDILHTKSTEVDLEYYEDPRYFRHPSSCSAGRAVPSDTHRRRPCEPGPEWNFFVGHGRSVVFLPLVCGNDSFCRRRARHNGPP